MLNVEVTSSHPSIEFTCFKLISIFVKANDTDVNDNQYRKIIICTLFNFDNIGKPVQIRH